MKQKKIFIATFFPLLLVSFLLSQSLVDVAKKEKERRETLKGKKVVVVTNADLTKLKKKPSVATAQLEPATAETITEAEAEFREQENPPTVESLQEVAPKAEEALETEGVGKKSGEGLKAEIEEKWNKAKEYVDLLETKMNGLWQKFYSFDDMISRDSIQKEISDTYLKVLKAQEDEVKAKEELDKFLASYRKEVPSI
jgi:hypothetical protein